MNIICREVSDAFWEIAEPLTPTPERDREKQYRRKIGGGGTPLEPRTVFFAGVYISRTGIQWKTLPKRIVRKPERSSSICAILVPDDRFLPDCHALFRFDCRDCDYCASFLLLKKEKQAFTLADILFLGGSTALPPGNAIQIHIVNVLYGQFLNSACK